MSDRWFLNTYEQLDNFTGYVKQRIADGSKTTVEFVSTERTTDQNALLHAILRDVFKQKGDESFQEIKRYVKLHFAVPMLRSRDEEFRAIYDTAIKNNLSYEQKLEAMDFLSVTSRLNKDEMSGLIDEVQRHYAEQGYNTMTHL